MNHFMIFVSIMLVLWHGSNGQDTSIYSGKSNDAVCQQIFNLQLELQNKIVKQEARITEQGTEIQVQHAKIEQQDSANERLQDEIQELKQRVQQQESANEGLQEKLNELKQQEPIGFTACPDSHRIYNAGDLVVFDRIISNFGNHYSASSSTFTCPLHGIYVLSVHHVTNTHTRLEIVRDNEELVETYIVSIDNKYTHGSASVVTECNVGQRIWARSQTSNAHMGWDRNCVFSGFLLHRFY